MSTKEKNPFPPNFTKKKFTIKIDVYENSQLFSIDFADQERVSYQEIIGVLEIQKISAIVQTSTNNIKEWIKQKERDERLMNKEKLKPNE